MLNQYTHFREDYKLNQSVQAHRPLDPSYAQHNQKPLRLNPHTLYGIRASLDHDEEAEFVQNMSASNDSPQVKRPPLGILRVPKRNKALWQPCGRSLHFTTAFQSVMFEDTSIDGATRDRDKLTKTI